jgi:membrane protein required for beta-lactamase induction
MSRAKRRQWLWCDGDDCCCCILVLAFGAQQALGGARVERQHRTQPTTGKRHQLYSMLGTTAFCQLELLALHMLQQMLLLSLTSGVLWHWSIQYPGPPHATFTAAAVP